MRAMTFCEIVLDQLPHVTKGERRAICAELEDHLADHAARLEEKGLSPEEARSGAEAAMGNPREIGRALAKQYPRLWLWAYRMLTLAFIAGCVLFLLQGPVTRIRAYWENLEAREDPLELERIYEYQTGVAREMDLRIELETDTLRIIQVKVDPKSMTAGVYGVNYDRDPWGRPASVKATIITQAGKETPFASYPWELWEGAALGYALYIPIEPGDTYLTFRYDRLGVEATFELPLPEWEGAE